MTREEFIDMLMAEYLKKQKFTELANQRKAEEEALAQEYKVDECNAKRNAIALKYVELQKAL